MALTKILPKIYEAFPLGRKRRPLVDWFYLRLLYAYKRYIEDPFAGLARKQPQLFRAGHVLDVGANVGYTASVFAKAIDPGYRVFAFEPEPLNVLRMRSMVKDVEVVQAAVGDVAGKAKLQINPLHPGDHRISESGIDVEMITIDDFVAQRRIGPVRFVKIDVQGYELHVSRGMAKLIEATPNLAVAFEYVEDAPELLDFYTRRGFSLRVLAHNGDLLDLRDLDRIRATRGYADLLASR